MIRYFLKFGKQDHVEEFAAGSLFCSNAVTFWDPASGGALFYSYSDGMVLRTLPSLEDLIDRAKGILEELSGD